MILCPNYKVTLYWKTDVNEDTDSRTVIQCVRDRMMRSIEYTFTKKFTAILRRVWRANYDLYAAGYRI